MTIDERYRRAKGEVHRLLNVNGQEATSTIADRSALPARAPAWSRWWRSYLRGALPVVDRELAGPLRAVDLFCGCGGLALGLQEAARAAGRRLHVNAAVDMDSRALAVYDRNLGPRATVCADVSRLVEFQIRGWGATATFAYPPELTESPLCEARGRTDVVVGGPPCQGHSNLNNRTRRDDPRNMLFLDAVATAVALKPRAILLENVPDVVYDSKGVVETARGLLTGAGFEVGADILHAHEMGLPQTRRRFFMSAARAGVVPMADISRFGARRHRVDVKWAIEDVEHTRVDTALDVTAELSPENARRIDWLFENDAYDLPDRLRPTCHRNGTTYSSVYGRLRWDAPAGTITTGFMTMGRGRYVHPSQRRTLTPREAARLQGFPDSFDFHPRDAAAPTKKALAKWIGDAVPPMLGYFAAMSVLPAVAGKGLGGHGA